MLKKDVNIAFKKTSTLAPSKPQPASMWFSYMWAHAERAASENGR